VAGRGNSYDDGANREAQRDASLRRQSCDVETHPVRVVQSEKKNGRELYSRPLLIGPIDDFNLQVSASRADLAVFGEIALNYPDLILPGRSSISHPTDLVVIMEFN
jgi:hypothetical protein